MPIADFPDGPVVKNPLANAESMGIIPAPGGFHILQGSGAHAPQLLNQRALEPIFHNKRSHCKRRLCTATREQPWLATTGESGEDPARP